MKLWRRFSMCLVVGLCSAGESERKKCAVRSVRQERVRPFIVYNTKYATLYWSWAERLFRSPVDSQRDGSIDALRQPVTCLAASPQGTFAACGDVFYHIREEPEYEAEPLFILENPVAALAVSPSRPICVVGMNRSYSMLDYLQYEVWAPFYKCVSSQSTPTLCYYDNNALYCSNGSSIVRYDDRDKKAALAVENAHLDSVRQLCKGPAYQFISASSGGSVRIWDVRQTNQNVRRFLTKPQEPITALVYISGVLAAGSDGGKIHTWSLIDDVSKTRQKYDEQSVVALAATDKGFAAVGGKLPFASMYTITK